MCFRYFVKPPPWKGWALYFELESPSTKDALCQVWLKLAQWFLRRRFFLNFANVFSLFCNCLPLEKGVVLYSNELKSHLPKYALCKIWLKSACWFLRKRFLNFVKCFRYFVIISPWKRVGPLFEQTSILFTQGCFLSSFVEIGPMVLEKKMKMWKV